QVGFKVLAGAGVQIDTTTANGRLVFGIFAALAEFEAELIRERTRAGLAAARTRGRRGGRPRKMTKEALRTAMTAISDQTTICFLIDFAALLYAKGFKLLALDRERTQNTATSC